MEKYIRLTELLQYINDRADRENNFDSLYKRLLNEYNLESHRMSELKKNTYLNALRLTRDKQAASYIYAKHRLPKSDHWSEYCDFVSHFRKDVTEALLLAKPNSASLQD